MGSDQKEAHPIHQACASPYHRQYGLSRHLDLYISICIISSSCSLAHGSRVFFRSFSVEVREGFDRDVILDVVMLALLLQNLALLLPARTLAFPGKQGGTRGVLEDLANPFIRLGRAFEVFLGANLLAHVFRLLSLVSASRCNTSACALKLHTHLFWCHRLLRRLVQLLNCLLVISQILLAADQDDGESLAEMEDFRDPLSNRKDYVSVPSRFPAAREHVRTFSCTLSSESGESTAKQMRMTCESG